MKAAVFPDPVGAHASTSRPCAAESVVDVHLRRLTNCVRITLEK